jgi:hypothetical protein
MGWSWGCIATVDRVGRTLFGADARHTQRLKDEIKAKLARRWWLIFFRSGKETNETSP